MALAVAAVDSPSISNEPPCWRPSAPRHETRASSPPLMLVWVVVAVAVVVGVVVVGVTVAIVWLRPCVCGVAIG